MIAVDVESTGTNSRKHSILAIGALDFSNPANRFYAECRAWDGAHIEKEALQITGFSETEIADPSKKTEQEIVQEFISWAKDGVSDWTFLAQNPSFDRGFLESACERSHIDFPFAHRTIDVHSLAYMHMTERGLSPAFDAAKKHTALSLDAVLRYVGVPEEPKPHNALTGALCHAECASRLLYGKPLLPEFEKYPIPWD